MVEDVELVTENDMLEVCGSTREKDALGVELSEVVCE